MALIKCKECGEEISKKASQCPKCGAPAKKKTSLFTWLVTILVVFWAVGYFSSYDGTSSSGSSTASRAPSPKTVALGNVELDFSWTKTGFDNIMEADFTVTNPNDFAIKDIEITCTHYTKSGTRIDSNERTIFDVVPGKSTMKFDDFNMGFIHTQADSTGCVITDLKI